jgi:hypothetical protein
VLSELGHLVKEIGTVRRAAEFATPRKYLLTRIDSPILPTELGCARLGRQRRARVRPRYARGLPSDHSKTNGWRDLSRRLLTVISSRKGRNSRALFPTFARLRHPEDDIAVALTLLPHGAELIDILRLEPYVKFAVRRATALEAGARGVRRGDHGIGGGRDGEPDQCNAAR